MQDDLITPENLSKELLMQVLDAAYMDTSYDSDGDIRVKEQCSCYVQPNLTARDRIRLAAFFGFKPEVPFARRLEFVNTVNGDYAMVRAVAVPESDGLVFDWYIPIAGGLTKKSFVLAVKRFCTIPHSAINEHGGEIVA
jgi:hypothetical protein